MHGASITASLAAGGRAVVHHDERYHWRPRGPDSRSKMAFSKKRHLAQGTPGLVYSSSHRSSRLSPFDPLHRHNRNRKTRTRHAVIGSACRRSDDRQRHDHKHKVDDPADDPADRTFGFARLKAMPGIWSRGLQCRTPPVRAPQIPDRIRVVRGSTDPRA